MFVFFIESWQFSTTMFFFTFFFLMRTRLPEYMMKISLNESNTRDKHE